MVQPEHQDVSRSMRRFAWLVSLTYLAIGTIWFLVSDQLLATVSADAPAASRIQPFAGLAFVAITAFILYFLVRRRGGEFAAMLAEPRVASSRRTQATVVLATSLLIVVILTNLIYELWEDRRSTIAEAESSAQNLAQVLEEQTSGMINSVDVTLESVGDILELDHPAYRVNDAVRIVERLRASLKPLPFVRALFILDDKGRMLYHTDGLPAGNIDFSDREYFQIHRTGQAPGLHIGHPLVSRLSKVWSINLSRRLTHPGGSFAGVTVAVLEPGYLERFYRLINVGAGGMVSLMLTDGTILARSPYIEAAMSKNFRDTALFTDQLPKAPAGIYEARSTVDFKTRIFSYRTFPEKPLVVSIGLDRDALLSKWQARAWTYGLVSAAFMLIIVWMGIRVVVELHRRDRLTLALRAGEERFRNALDDMLEGCQIIGFDWRYRYVNDSALQHGRRARNELLGRTIMEVHPGIETSEMFAAIRRCINEQLPQRRQDRFEYDDGSYAWFDLSIQPVPEGIFILSIDITRQKLAEEALRQLNEQLEARVNERTAALNSANRELEAFGYSVSHDLRAPLRHLDGFARMVMERSADMDGKTRDYLSRIVKSSEKMGDLIDDLLALSRAGRAELKTQPVDLEALVSGAREECMSDAGQRDVEWRIDELPRVQGDNVLLRQAFMNLLNNAVKFTRHRERAVIEIRAQLKAGREVEISVRDNGAGFDMRYADNLYGVFQRLHHESEFEGTGIGLAIVRRIIERHGGKTWAESELGKGATFYLTLTIT